MKPEEVISVGKHWVWMTIFSTCLFASCGETNRHSQEPTAPEPQADVKPIRYDREIIQTNEIEREELDPQQFVEFPDADIDDLDLERFEDEDDEPEESEELGVAENEDIEIHEVSDARKNHRAPVTIAALREVQDSVGPAPRQPSTPTPAPSPPAKNSTDPHAKWIAQFQNIGNSDDFEPDSADDFE